MKGISEYIEENRELLLTELIEFLKIPSVSADSQFKNSVKEAAEWLANSMTHSGISDVKIFPTNGHPIVYGEKIIHKDLPTVLVYGHYDVQPADPYELWDSNPFEPIVKKTDLHPQGAIYARGACDDKGQMFMHIKAFEFMHKTDQLACNVKFMIEGEEEIGSVHLGKFCEENKDLLSCDVILISDTSIIANDTPSITTGLRGLSYVEVEVTGPNRDLHSGVYGGAVANPINVLSKMISSLFDSNHRIQIPGFYEEVLELTDWERNAISKAPFDLDKYKKELAIEKVEGENGYSTIERASTRPSLDVNGIWGGYTGEGAKTVLPSKAYAKISMRLVPNQDPDKITHMFSEYFRSIAPSSVEVKVTPHHGGKPTVVSTISPEYLAASKAMESTFGKEPIPARSGGSIPIVALFKEILGADSVLLGFGLNSDAIHSPNEHYGLFNYYKGIETIPYFYYFYNQLKLNTDEKSI
jgi:acetylornithine deacetylase/succinyl-diaminopimelate desuccinylase-like protein